MHNIFKNKLGAAALTIDLGVVQMKLFINEQKYFTLGSYLNHFPLEMVAKIFIWVIGLLLKKT